MSKSYLILFKEYGHIQNSGLILPNLFVHKIYTDLNYIVYIILSEDHRGWGTLWSSTIIVLIYTINNYDNENIPKHHHNGEFLPTSSKSSWKNSFLYLSKWVNTIRYLLTKNPRYDLTTMPDVHTSNIISLEYVTCEVSLPWW